jgi:hypothetical protein
LSFSKSRRKEEKEEEEAIPLGILGFYFQVLYKKENQYNSWFSKGREAKVMV